MATYAPEPIQVYLLQEEYDALQALAKARGVSLAELMHEGVAAMLAHTSTSLLPDQEARTTEISSEDDPFRDLIGAFDSGVTDLAENHDKYLMEFEIKSNRR